MWCHFAGRTRGLGGDDVRWVQVTIGRGPREEMIGRGPVKMVRIALGAVHDALTWSEGLYPTDCPAWCSTTVVTVQAEGCAGCP